MPTCDRCFGRIDVRTRQEAVFLGWVPKNPDTGLEYGWTCPACVGKPIEIRPRPKRSR
jgi:hypothetical protein